MKEQTEKYNLSTEELLRNMALRIAIRYGDTEAAHNRFLEASQRFVPPFPSEKLTSAWNSAVAAHAVISQANDYIDPEAYNRTESYLPEDFSDVGEAEVLARLYRNKLCYTIQAGFLYYDGVRWIESESMAQKCVHDLTQLQLEEAERNMELFSRAFLKAGGSAECLAYPSRVKATLNDHQKEVLAAYDDQKQYHKFVLKCRMSKNISAILKEVRPLLEIPYSSLDADPFLLNTPTATYDLRKGLDGARPHDPGDHITKVTAVSPGDDGASLWQSFLQQICCGDQELIRYIQLVLGLSVIGAVFIEAMIISYGEGRNGKSTLFNVVARILDSYSGHLSAETLTQECHRNVKPELAELKGKRLIIAAELKSSSNLNDGIIKQLCSTDEIFAEKKYRSPFAFLPSHTLVLYTNHLPTISATDDGTWRRLIVIPFRAKIEGSADVKNYTELLYEQAGSSILAWLIQGAKDAISLQYHIPKPECVQALVKAYRAENDWLSKCLDSCCVIGSDLTASSEALYTAFRAYCLQQVEKPQSTAAFYAAIEKAGFKRITQNRRRYFQGLALTNPSASATSEMSL